MTTGVVKIAQKQSLPLPRRGTTEASDSKTTDVADQTFNQSTTSNSSHRYSTRKQVKVLPAPYELPVVRRNKLSTGKAKSKSEEQELIGLIAIAVHSVQKMAPSGKSAAMKWSMKVEQVGDQLYSAFINKSGDEEARELFHSKNLHGLKELILNKSKGALSSYMPTTEFE